MRSGGHVTQVEEPLNTRGSFKATRYSQGNTRENDFLTIQLGRDREAPRPVKPGLTYERVTITRKGKRELGLRHNPRKAEATKLRLSVSANDTLSLCEQVERKSKTRYISQPSNQIKWQIPQLYSMAPASAP